MTREQENLFERLGLIGGQITVTERARRGRTNLHTFVYWRDGHWSWSSLESRKQITAARQGDRGWTHGGPSTRPDVPLHEWPTAIHLADGVDIEPITFVLILNALRRAGRRRVDLADIKTVISQLGSQLARLHTLDCEQLGQAKHALYTEIVRRCTTL